MAINHQTGEGESPAHFHANSLTPTNYSGTHKFIFLAQRWMGRTGCKLCVTDEVPFFLFFSFLYQSNAKKYQRQYTRTVRLPLNVWNKGNASHAFRSDQEKQMAFPSSRQRHEKTRTQIQPIFIAPACGGFVYASPPNRLHSPDSLIIRSCTGSLFCFSSTARAVEKRINIHIHHHPVKKYLKKNPLWKKKKKKKRCRQIHFPLVVFDVKLKTYRLRLNRAPVYKS